MTLAVIGIAYCLIILSMTRLVHVLRAQEYRLRENQQGAADGTLSAPARSNVVA